MDCFNRTLWQQVSGGSLIHDEELVESELNKNIKKIVDGVHYFSKFVSDNASHHLQAKKNLQSEVQIQFVVKLAKFLNLDILQSYDLFCLFLLNDFRGSQKELLNLLKSERFADSLIMKLRQFYQSERLYLLRVLKHVLAFWQQDSHPYRMIYTSFLEQILEHKIIDSVLSQYDNLCNEIAPSWESHGHLMTEQAASQWMLDCLHEQAELLEILILFYKDFEHSAHNLLELLSSFKKQGFGRRQLNRHLLTEACEPLLHRIGFLQCAVIIEAVDLDFLLQCHQDNRPSEHHIVQSDSFDDLQKIMSSLGDLMPHGPVLLTWALVAHLSTRSGSDVGRDAMRFGKAAVKLHVFKYLSSMMTHPLFTSDTLVAKTVSIVIQSLIRVLLSIFHESTLGQKQDLFDVVSKVLRNESNTGLMMFRGPEDGLGSLVESTIEQVPYLLGPALNLSIAISESGPRGVHWIANLWSNLKLFTELLDNNPVWTVDNYRHESWELTKSKFPKQQSDFCIPAGTKGIEIHQDSGGRLISWNIAYNGWNLLLAEILQVVSESQSGTVQVGSHSQQLVCSIAKLTILQGKKNIPEKIFDELSSRYLFVLQRFSSQSPANLNLISSCLEVVRAAAHHQPEQMWHMLKQINFLPFFHKGFTDHSEITSGVGITQGHYSAILAGSEWLEGRYLVTQSLLGLMSSLVKPLRQLGHDDELTAVLVMIMREVFPVYAKWRYQDVAAREQIGQLCLELFRQILTIYKADDVASFSTISLCSVVVYGLLYREAGMALLGILSTGVDTIEGALSEQGSITEGHGTRLVSLVTISFSVMNRLLMLKPDNEEPSAVERALSTQPLSASRRHLVATIAQYIFHRHDPSLPKLATVLLKRISMVFPMSILACLGNEAEAIRDAYLAHLEASTEDTHLKVCILELLTECVDSQPALMELFLNIDGISDDKEVKSASSSKKCLDVIMALLSLEQGSARCPSDLLQAILKFVQALWTSGRSTAIDALKNRSEFWSRVCRCLFTGLPSFSDDNVNSLVLQMEISSVASVLTLLTYEMYNVPLGRRDASFTSVLKRLAQEQRIKYWSKYLSDNIKCLCQQESEEEKHTTFSSSLSMLIAWKNFIFVVNSHGKTEDPFSISGVTKLAILRDLLSAVRCLTSTSIQKWHYQFAIETSATYFTLLHSWWSRLSSWNETVEELLIVLDNLLIPSQMDLPALEMAIYSSLLIILQRHSHPKESDLSLLSRQSKSVCRGLSKNLLSLPSPVIADTANAQFLLKVQLIISNLSLMQEMILKNQEFSDWIDDLRSLGIVPMLLSLLQAWLQAKLCPNLCLSILILLDSIASIPKTAETIGLFGFSKHVCLQLAHLYGEPALSHPSVPSHADVTADASLVKPGLGPASSKGYGSRLGNNPNDTGTAWMEIYCLTLTTASSLLKTLQFAFLHEAFNFVGSHEERMFQCLERTGRVDLAAAALHEATVTVRFLTTLAVYRRQWKLHLPHVALTLTKSISFLSQRCVSLLMKPRYMQYILKKQRGFSKGSGAGHKVPHMKRLSREGEGEPTLMDSEMQKAQDALLLLLRECLSFLLIHTPSLCDTLCNPSADLSDFTPLLVMGLNTPQPDEDTDPSFGTYISCATLCINLIAKFEPTSPSKGARLELSPNSSSGSSLSKTNVVNVLERSLYLVMCEAMKFIRDPQVNFKDKQILKRELAADLKTLLQSVQRQSRRSGIPTSPSTAPANKSAQQTPILNRSFSCSAGSPTPVLPYFTIVNNFIQNVLV